MAREGAEAVADRLCEASLEIERVDYNVLADEELRAILDAKATLDELCLRYRRESEGWDA